MGDYRAIAGACEAVKDILRSAFDPAQFDRTIEFKVYTGKDFEEPISTGLSLFLYRIFHFGVNKTPSGRLDNNGKRMRPKLPLELHVLLTSWAPTADLQHKLIGWAMRVLEDTPIISSAVLRMNNSKIFFNDESIEIVPTELSTENLFRIWETVTDKNYQISVPYVIRIVFLDSMYEEYIGVPVQQRDLELK